MKSPVCRTINKEIIRVIGCVTRKYFCPIILEDKIHFVFTKTGSNAMQLITRHDCVIDSCFLFWRLPNGGVYLQQGWWCLFQGHIVMIVPVPSSAAVSTNSSVSLLDDVNHIFISLEAPGSSPTMYRSRKKLEIYFCHSSRGHNRSRMGWQFRILWCKWLGEVRINL